MTKDKDSSIDKTTQASITIDIVNTLFSYEGKKIDMLISSNLPHANVEDKKHWKSWNIIDGNPNLIGQIHFMSNDKENFDNVYLVPKFHLCYNPGGKVLTKDDLKAIIKVMDEFEQFKIDKNVQHKKLDRKK